MLNTTEKQKLRSLIRKKENIEFQLEAIQEKRSKLEYAEKQLLDQLSNFKEEIDSLHKKEKEESK